VPLEPPLELPPVAVLLEPPEPFEPLVPFEPLEPVVAEPAAELVPATPLLEPPLPTLPPVPGLPAAALPAVALVAVPAEPGAPALPPVSAGAFESPHAGASNKAQHGNAQAKTPLMKRELSVLEWFTRVLCDEPVKTDQRSHDIYKYFGLARFMPPNDNELARTIG